VPLMVSFPLIAVMPVVFWYGSSYPPIRGERSKSRRTQGRFTGKLIPQAWMVVPFAGFAFA